MKIILTGMSFIKSNKDWRGECMKVNPFILKRENILPKGAIRQEFDTSLIQECYKVEQLLETSRNKMIASLNEILKQSNHPVMLDSIRYLRKYRYYKFIMNSEKIEELVHETLLKEIKGFKDLYYRYLDLLESAETLYEKNVKEMRQRFINILEENSFITSGLHMINPQIHSKLNSYLNTPLELHKSKHRKLEGTLYNFISRSALKTSPFSNITNVGRVELSNKYVESKSYSKAIALNFTFVYRLTFFYLYHSDLFLEKTNYTIPPFSISTVDGQHYIEFLSKKESTRTKVYLSEERLGKLKIPLSLVELFNAKNMENYINFKELHSTLGNEVPKEKIYIIIRHYLNVGLLIPAIGFNEKNYDVFIEDIKRKLAPLVEEKNYLELITYIDDVYKLSIQAARTEDIIEKHNFFKQLNSILREIEEKTNIKFAPNQVFYEDGYYTDVEYIDKENLDKFLDPLKNIQTFSLIFDTSVRMCFEFAARLSKLGNHDYLEMDSDFFSILFGLSKDMTKYWENPAYIASDQFHSEDLKKLDILKQEFISDLNHLCRNCISDTVDIKELVDAYIARIPSKVGKTNGISTGVFAQIYGENLIINSLYEGQERYSARFMNYFKDYLNDSNDYQSFIKDFYDDNNYYELTDTYGFNGNVKEHRLSRECYNLGVGTRRFSMENSESLHRVEDFLVKVNDQFKFIDRNGKEARICFRGSLTPTYMPGYIAMLLQMFTPGAMYYKLGEMVKEESIPRITYENIILTRKRIRLTYIERHLMRKEKESDFEYYKRLNLVFSDLDLNKEFFVVIDRSTQLNDEDLYKFKPLYINIENPLSVKVFEKEVADRFDKSIYKLLFMEEYLSNSGSHVKELNYEIYQKGELYG